MLHEETIAFSWDVPEFEYKEKSRKWYYIIGGIALIGIILAIIFGNYLFGFIILVAGFIMVTLAGREPKINTIEISDYGIHISEEKNPYTQMDTFWITQNKEGEYILLFHLLRNINPIESIVIHPEIDLLELREYLLDYLDEEEMKEPLADRIIRKIGF